MQVEPARLPAALFQDHKLIKEIETMPDTKMIAWIAGIALVAVAVANRVPAIGALVYPTTVAPLPQ